MIIITAQVEEEITLLRCTVLFSPRALGTLHPTNNIYTFYICLCIWLYKFLIDFCLFLLRIILNI